MDSTGLSITSDLPDGSYHFRARWRVWRGRGSSKPELPPSWSIRPNPLEVLWRQRVRYHPRWGTFLIHDPPLYWTVIWTNKILNPKFHTVCSDSDWYLNRRIGSSIICQPAGCFSEVSSRLPAKLEAVMCCDVHVLEMRHFCDILVGSLLSQVSQWSFVSAHVNSFSILKLWFCQNKVWFLKICKTRLSSVNTTKQR